MIAILIGIILMLIAALVAMLAGVLLTERRHIENGDRPIGLPRPGTERDRP
jgi:hypothetical protein